MGKSHFHFQLDTSPDVDAVLEAWSAAGGARPAAVERLVESKHKKTYDRAGIFRLLRVGRDGAAVVAKHGKSEKLFVEALIYRDVLPKLSLSAPAYYGYVSMGSDAWLFMEDVAGETFSATSSAHSELAVRWLATLHTGTSQLDLAERLPAEGPEQYRPCIDSTRKSLLASVDTLESNAKHTVHRLLTTLDAIERTWYGVCDRCATMPHCLVHADFVYKNVFIVSRGDRAELIALDWGIAGWGVPAPDLEYFDPAVYFALVKPVWPDIGLADVAYLRSVGVVMRQLGLVEVWASCLRDEPEWAMERLEESARKLEDAHVDL